MNHWSRVQGCFFHHTLFVYFDFIFLSELSKLKRFSLLRDLP